MPSEPVAVTVTTPGGSHSVPAAFAYAAPPVIHSIEPNQGPRAGGNLVTIKGDNLEGVEIVRLGARAESYRVVDDETIEFTAPPGAGTVVLSIAGPHGNAQRPAAYRFLPAPVIASVSPDSGTVDGGTQVTIKGQNFTGTVTVTIGGSPASSVTVVDSETIVATVPPRTADA